MWWWWWWCNGTVIGWEELVWSVAINEFQSNFLLDSFECDGEFVHCISSLSPSHSFVAVTAVRLIPQMAAVPGVFFLFVRFPCRVPRPSRYSCRSTCVFWSPWSCTSSQLPPLSSVQFLWFPFLCSFFLFFFPFSLFLTFICSFVYYYYFSTFFSFHHLSSFF